ncbi:hypothetical protein F5Y07DRAFT_244027 [Xylaria sp. FL0933]|nr:hypothetical protein F5Y07DRAFT_244027 [Xylaria sp. FL0933]
MPQLIAVRYPQDASTFPSLSVVPSTRRRAIGNARADYKEEDLTKQLSHGREEHETEADITVTNTRVLHGSEGGQGATTLAVVGISPTPPQPHSQPPDTNLFGDDECQAWGGLSRFNTDMSLGPATNWNQRQYDGLATTVALGHAAALTHTSNHSHYLAPPLANVPQNAAMSHTDVQSSAQIRAQPIHSQGPFAPVANEAAFNNGFTDEPFVTYAHEPLYGPEYYHYYRYNEPLYGEETHEAPLDHIVVNNRGHSLTAPGTPVPNAYKAVGQRIPQSRRQRSHLWNRDREETRYTRQLRACIRCRFQRIRCIPDPSKAETESCMTCQKVLPLETKKVIHRIPCLRWRLNDILIFRQGGLNLTRRWKGVTVQNLRLGDWVDERVVTIGICITTLRCEPLSLTVRRFKPNPRDVIHRYCRSKETEAPILITLPPYALFDVRATTQDYKSFVERNAEEEMRRFTKDPTVNELVRSTFAVALSHRTKLAGKDLGRLKGDPAKMLHFYFRMWFAARFSMGSAYITNGHENLEGNAYPSTYRGKHYLPRMITAQFDSIVYTDVLAEMRRYVLDELWLLMQRRRPTSFFSVYLVIFMMLHEISIGCQDRHRRAKEQGLKTYYDLEDVAAELKLGADVLLAHWHYFKAGIDPLDLHQGNAAKYFGADNQVETNLIVRTCQKYTEMEDKPLNQVGWEQNPLQLASRMFEKDWKPFHFNNNGPV